MCGCISFRFNSYFIFLHRVIWGILVLTAIGIFLANMINRLEYYFSYQKTINVEVEYLDEIEFPAVTICNENQYKSVHFCFIAFALIGPVVGVTDDIARTCTFNCTNVVYFSL